ncbi:MAG TPA: hypothetical protein VFS30_00595 [Dehalococcoidia bacterium]|jgi:hypothetical protein|nr:hypothetical protein [Dehalococcoidia bacterium]
MAKSSGLGDQLYVNGYNLSNDIKAVTRLGFPSAHLERTGIDKSAHERAFGLVDGEIAADAYWNSDAGQSHPVLRASLTDALVTYFRGTAQGNVGVSLVAHKVAIGQNRSADGDIIMPVQFMGSGYGLEYGLQMTAGVIQSTGAETLTGVDFGDDVAAAETDFGLAAYLHVFDFDGDDVTITIQESDDNGGSDAFGNITGGAFTQITTAPVTERIETALDQTIEQYLTLDLTTSAGYTSVDFAVMIIRYYSANRNEGATA